MITEEIAEPPMIITLVVPHSHYAIYNTGNHVQPSGSGTYVHHTGVTHEHHGGGFSPQNGGGEHGGFGGRR